MAVSTRQYLRECEVVVGAAGHGLSIRDLRIQFEVTKTIGRVPNTALIKIYNLTPDHENRIRDEFDEVLLNAGYKGAELLVFRGNIRHAFRYREGNDYITEIDAADGDKDFRRAIVNVALARGTSTAQLVDHVVGTFSSTKKGHVVIKERKRIRGAVFSGLAREMLDKVAAESDAHWSIQDGLLQIVPVDSTLPHEAIVLRSDTGLLGAPQIDDKGITVKCFLNPRIKVNGKVWLNNNDLKAKIAKEHEKKAGAKPKATKKKNRELARLDPDGIYKVIKLTHKGDTRGGDWETEVLCIGLEKAIPAGKQAA